MFRVGQKVVCVDAACDPGRFWFGTQPTVGTVYTISGFGKSPHGGYLVLRLEELSSHPWGYRATRFRPVVERKTDISIFTAMLNPAKKKRRADRPVTVS